MRRATMTTVSILAGLVIFTARAPSDAAGPGAARPGGGAVGAVGAVDDDGAALIGTPAPAWTVGTWFNSPPLTIAGLRGKVVLVRWFMDPSCPLCNATAPSLRGFDATYRARGLVVVGMYHHKAKAPLRDADVRGYLATYGFRFPVAIDPDWRTLRRWWLDGHDRPYTSVTFLIDRRGRIRTIHRGGRLAPGEPDHVRMDRAIHQLLAEPA